MPARKSRNKQKPRLGGARQGAGRPREFKDKAQLVVQLELVEADALRELAWESRQPLSRYLRGLIQRHLKAKGRLPSH